MNIIVERFVSRLETLRNETGKSRTAKKLMKLSDDQLDDMGVSRFELQKGAAAYPWTYAKSSENNSRAAV